MPPAVTGRPNDGFGATFGVLVGIHHADTARYCPVGHPGHDTSELCATHPLSVIVDLRGLDTVRIYS